MIVDLLALGIIVYLGGTVVFGCPKCFKPNLTWPVDFLISIKEEVREGDE